MNLKYNMNIRTRIIVLVSSIMVTLACVIALFLYQEDAHSRQELVSRNQEAISSMLVSSQHSLDRRYSARLKSFVRIKHRIMTAFAARDREGLFELSQVYLDVLKQENKLVSAMFFITPDNAVFLRVHKPDVYGDDVGEFSPLGVQANRTRQPMSGLESGRMGLHYRVIQPVFVNDRYVGLVGLGIDARFMLAPAMNSSTEVALLFSKKQTEVMAFLTERPVSFAGSFLYHDSSAFFHDLQVRALSAKEQSITVNNRIYSLFIGTALTDFKGRELARILVASDITSEVKGHWQRMKFILLLILALLVAVGMALYFGFGRMLNRISGLQKKLKKQNLLLEGKVLERTARLEKEIEQRQETDCRYKDLVETSSDWIWEMDENL